MSKTMIGTSFRPRSRATLAGLAVIAAVAFGAVVALSMPARASGGEAHLKHVEWSFQGPFGTYDRDALRRGYKVYKEVCATCHSLKLVHFRNLGEPGGPEFDEEQVKALAAEVQVQDGPNADGEMYEREGRPSDAFPAPYPNEEAAAAALGAVPPDLSLLAKAREGGPDYLYSLLTGYEEAPEGVAVPAGGNYNPVFAAGSGIIAMPAPLSDGLVDYEDGTQNTLDQQAKDVSQFLMWTAEPKLEQRHRLGFQVFIYLLVLAGLLYFVSRKVWHDQH